MRQIVGIVVGIVGDDQGADLEAAFDEAQDLGAEGLGAVPAAAGRSSGEDRRSTTASPSRDILEDGRRRPLERLRTLVHVFIRSECDEAAMRVALDAAAPLYRDAPSAREARASWATTGQVFMEEALPDATRATRLLAADLITTTLSKVGKRFSETPRTPAQIEAYAAPWPTCFAPVSSTCGAEAVGARPTPLAPKERHPHMDVAGVSPAFLESRQDHVDPQAHPD